MLRSKPHQDPAHEGCYILMQVACWQWIANTQWKSTSMRKNISENIKVSE